MIDWINENKEWLFSGVGVTLIVIIVSTIIKNFSKKKSDRTINMKGDKSVYIEKNDGEIDINQS